MNFINALEMWLGKNIGLFYSWGFPLIFGIS